jgi:hypothetical protein
MFESFLNSRLNHAPYDFGDLPVTFGNRSYNLSDISAHMPLLSMLASFCDHITEFGCRTCYSTSAFIAGCNIGGKVVSYDIVEHQTMIDLSKMELPVKWEYKIQDTSLDNFTIEETDMLFIDSLHTYQQVKAELNSKHTDRVKKFLVFHDVVSQGEKSLDVPGQIGINKAINEFLDANKKWRKIYYATFNHGLLVLRKDS